jgi:hypothetical protein
VIRYSPSTVLALFLAFVASAAAPVYAQPPAAPAVPAATPPSTDDDEKLRPLEPDFSLVNLPTTLPLPVHAGNFHLTHRFNENLRLDSFGTQASNLFGLDQGATIQFEYRFGLMKHLEVIASRTNVDRKIQFGAKLDLFSQSTSNPVGPPGVVITSASPTGRRPGPFGLSAIVSVEGGNNFQERYAPALGAVVSRTVANTLAVYVTPVWAHNTFPGTGIMRDTFYVGIGARVKIVPALYLVGEMAPRAGGFAPGDAEFAFSLEKRVGAHMFSVTFANTSATTYGQIARGGNPESLYLGFNLARKFF